MARGNVLIYVGRPAEGVELIAKAMRLNPHYPSYYLTNLGTAYRVAGQYEEAIAALKRALARNDLLLTHISLAVTYSESGQEEEARAEGGEVLRLNPNFSLEVWGQMIPYRDPAYLERYLAALRKAGLK